MKNATQSQSAESWTIDASRPVVVITTGDRPGDVQYMLPVLLVCDDGQRPVWRSTTKAGALAAIKVWGLETWKKAMHCWTTGDTKVARVG